MIFHDYSGFFSNFMIFPCMELFFHDFPWFPELVGTLIFPQRSTQNSKNLNARVIVLQI